MDDMIMIIFTGRRKWSDSQQFQRAECWPVDTSVRRQFYSSLRKVFPGGSKGKESACSAGDLGLNPELGRSSLPTPVFLSGESHRQQSQVVNSPRGCKQSDTTKQLLLTDI